MKSGMSLFDLNHAVALVTGGGSGLGREFCRVLAEFGAGVVCVDLYEDRAKETCMMIEEAGHNTMALQGDVSDYQQVRSVFEKVEEAFGRLDILVNNAGITNLPCHIDKMDVQNWQKVIDVNLHGTFYCMKEALKLMLPREKGSIVNVASITGLRGTEPEVALMAPYSTSKAGIIGLTRQAAAEYGSRGIRVNAIAPGWHLGTRLGADAGITRTREQVDSFRAVLSSRTPLKRTGEPTELNGLLMYLASDASSFVTGQVIASDGGWTCI